MVALAVLAVLWGSFTLLPAASTSFQRPLPVASGIALAAQPDPGLPAPSSPVLPPLAGSEVAAPPAGPAEPVTSAAPEAPVALAPAIPPTALIPSTAATSPTAVTQAAPGGPVTVPQAGSGEFTVAPGEGAVAGAGPTAVRYSVEIEGGLTLDPATVAAEIDGILTDRRSWIGLGRWQVQRVSSGPDARVVIATPDTVDRLCSPLQTAGTYSCRNGPYVVLNAVRWVDGAQSWGDDVAGYRGYLVNHEFGHFLGFGHTPCPAAGAPAPVMVQQTKGLSGCVANAWPTVTGG